MTTFTDYTKVHCLGLIGVIADDWFEAQREVFILRHFDGDWERYQAAVDDGLSQRAELPKRADLTDLAALVRDTSCVPYVLGYEDKKYLAMARTQLVDALIALADGDIDSCARYLDDGASALDFITNRRKRTDKRDFHQPFEAMRSSFARLTARATALADRIGHVAVSA